MYIENRYISLAFKGLVSLLGLYALGLYFGFLKGQISFSSLKYYTVQSNILVLIYFIAATIYTYLQIKRSGNQGAAVLFPKIKNALTMAILVTMLIFMFLLSDSPFIMITGESTLENNLVHLYIPLLVLLDWLLFDPKGKQTIIEPLTWIIIPYLYLIYAMIAAKFGITYSDGSHYPYPFMNADKLGRGQVVVNIFFITLAFIVLGYVLWSTDKLFIYIKKFLKKHKERKKRRSKLS